jgi:F-type H+-transporting ATPase subunit delta
MSRIANRYSKALFQLAKEQEKQDLILEDLLQLEKMIDESFELKAMLRSPLIQGEVKAKMLLSVFEDVLDDLTCRFLNLLCLKRRSEYLTDVIRQYEEYILIFKGVIKSKIISAVALDREQMEKIKGRISDLTGKEILLEPEINRDLIGGFVIKLEDTVIDLSVHGQLEILRKQLIYGSY